MRLSLRQDEELVKVPLVADILRLPDCLRVASWVLTAINPGNIGREDRVRAVVDAARDRGIPTRIGVHAGSWKRPAKKYGEPTRCAGRVCPASRRAPRTPEFPDSSACSASDVFWPSKPTACWPKNVQPLHLGITEAGGLRSGTVKSAVGLVCCSLDWDVIRISLALTRQ
jgi:(E)-4-hydroxy-3-methylbut-2-enyl-diphosphate synthase